jgi:putative peptide zinc metalloprotease protein
MVAPQVMTAADRPLRATDVTLHRRPDDGVALLERRGRYVQLSRAAAAIWQLCDGEHDVDAIAQSYRERYAVDGTPAIAALLDRWHRAGLVARGLDVADGRTSEQTCSVVRSGAGVYVAWRVERWAPLLRWMARAAFAPPVLLALAAIALSGGALALRIGTRSAVHGAAQTLALAVALGFAVIVHEAGHALTLARFGGTIRRIGIGWYWCAPVAFVDTSDAHALPRAQRIGVSLGGPLASFVLAGLAALVASCALPESVRSLAWSLAIVNYGVSLWNLNPLIELDGYYILADLLGRPNLRSDAFRALRRRCASRVELAYAAGALTYALVIVGFVLHAVIPAIAIDVRALFAM